MSDVECANVPATPSTKNITALIAKTICNTLRCLLTKLVISHDLSSQQLAVLVSFNARVDAHHFHRDRDHLDARHAHDHRNTQLQLESYND